MRSLLARIPIATWLAPACLLAAWGDLRSHAVGAVAVMLGWGVAVTSWCLVARPRPGPSVLVAALAARWVLALPPPTLSDDLYRYLWEGRVVAHGGNPYLQPPDDPALAHLRNATWEQVAHRQVPTIYPPLALGAFWTADRLHLGPTGWRMAVSAVDVTTVAALARLAPAWPGAAVLWALHPLPVLESGASGHLEGPALALLAWGWLAWRRGRRALGALAVGAAGLLKVVPLALLPAMFRPRERPAPSWPPLAALALVAAALAALGPGALGGWRVFALRWSFNGLLWPLLPPLFGGDTAARQAAAAIGLVAALVAWRRADTPERFALWCCGVLLLLAPVVHPWYVLWALLPALVVGSAPWVALATAVLAAYLVLDGYRPGDATTWQEVPWVPWMERATLLVAWWLGRRRPGRPSAGPAPSA